MKRLGKVLLVLIAVLGIAFVALRSDYRVIRYDTIGHGLTGAVPGKDYSAEAMAALVGRVADKLGLDKFVLGGNSMGGGVSVTYALAHQDRLSGLLLVDAGGAPKPGGEPGNIGFKLAATPGVNNIIKWITPRRPILRPGLRHLVYRASPAELDAPGKLA